MPSSTKTKPKASAKEFVAWESPLELDKKREELGGISLQELAAVPFESLGRFKQAGAFPHGYDRDYLTFYAPRDTGVHLVLLWTLMQAKSSVAINMYGFDDRQIASLLQHHAKTPHMIVTLTLDSTESKTGIEPELLELLHNDLEGNSIAIGEKGQIAIGRSEKHAISHDKLMVVDGLYLISGSTNWSFGGETDQDNQLTLTRDPIACAEARAVIDLDHDVMLKQMVEKLLEEERKKAK